MNFNLEVNFGGEIFLEVNFGGEIFLEVKYGGEFNYGGEFWR